MRQANRVSLQHIKHFLCESNCDEPGADTNFLFHTLADFSLPSLNFVHGPISVLLSRSCYTERKVRNNSFKACLALKSI